MREELDRIGESVRAQYEAQKRVLSFWEYLDQVAAHPARHTRDAARYLRDCVEHYGSEEVKRPWGVFTRHRLFDQPFDEDGPLDGERRNDRLIGCEAVQTAFVRSLDTFVREGRANKLLLLHGPNGSAKTTFTRALMRGLEHYSQLDEGALYRFSWIFPRGRDGKTIGFGSSDDVSRSREAFAHLPDSRVDVKLPSSTREHPLVLLPVADRRRIISEAYSAHGESGVAPDWVWRGALGHKNQQVFDALLQAYRGDLQKVLNHVQVERYYVSQRYRVGAVTIGPQMAVDASERQITADRTLNALPASLSALTLFEPYGELVDAAGGIVEFSDLLKRPLDAWKYLLLAIETGEVALPLSNLAINAVFMASSNEIHLAAFREHHEYTSFRGRIHPIRVPYLRDYTQEQGIYDAHVAPRVRGHVAPHATFVASLWAVLTRLQRSVAERYESSTLGKLAADLAPMEKAELYAHAAIPDRLNPEDAKLLKVGVTAVWNEWDSVPDYEGLTGASPRAMRAILLDAANHRGKNSLTPRGVLDAIEAFCQRSDYEFLKQSPDRGYRDHRGFIRQVHAAWLERIDEEFREASGLIAETQYQDLFAKYVTHVSYWVKGEKVFNPVTGVTEDPDKELMRGIEGDLGMENGEEFRRNLISAVAAHAIDNPGDKPDYPRIFPRYFEQLREANFRDRRKQLGTLARDSLMILEDAEGTVPEQRRPDARETLERMKQLFGYDADSLLEAIDELVTHRYAE